MNPPRLLYVGFAFPPGIAGHFPELQPAGHLIETSMINSVRPWFEVRSVGISGLRIEALRLPHDASPGLSHHLNLLDKAPEIFYRYYSFLRLKRAYRAWAQGGWRPDAIMVCNLSPVYNGFVRWLRRQPGPKPLLILYLADSTSLGLSLPWHKRLRYRFKPLVYSETEMLDYFDACVATSRSTEKYFANASRPWLWLPNGCDPKRALPPSPGLRGGLIRFGYFGALAEHAGAPALLKVFTTHPRTSTLDICGYGKAKTAIAEFCRTHPGLRFFGPRTPDECLQFAAQCEVLVNPRPIWPGNENNFSSKVFEYALAGRAILSSKLSGVDLILGEDAYYFNEREFERSLDECLERIAALPRRELERRGAALQIRFVNEYSWARQGERLAQFIQKLLR